MSLIARLGEQEAVRKEWVTTHAQVAASAGCSSCFTHSANYSIHSCGYVYICGCVCVCACVLRVYLCVHRHAVYVSMCTCLCAVNTHMRMCMCAYMVRACYVLAGPGAPSRAVSVGEWSSFHVDWFFTSKLQMSLLRVAWSIEILRDGAWRGAHTDSPAGADLLTA